MLASHSSPVIYLSENALIRNYRLLVRAAGGAEVIAVIKANAYGHGASLLLPSLLAEGARCFAVANGTEALALSAFFSKKPSECKDIFTYKPCLLVLGTVTEKELLPLCSLNVILSVHSLSYATSLAASLSALRARGLLSAEYRLPTAIKCECGMNRLGLSRVKDALALFDMPFITPVMLYSHLGESAPDATRFIEGRARFSVFSSLLSRMGHPLLTHLAASGAIAHGASLGLDAVRAGLALYGVAEGIEGLLPVMRLSARVLSVKRLARGEGLGYGSYRAQHPMRVACLAVGYADGIPPSASGARIGAFGTLLPIVGEVCMDRTFAEVGELPLVEGDEVTVFGESAEDTRRFARECRISPYALLSVRSERTERILS